MTFSLTAGLTVPFLAFVLASGFINGLHPALTSTLPLILSSYLGNERHLHKALHGMALFIVLLGGEWLLIGLGMSALAYFGSPETVWMTLAIALTLAGALEVKTAINSKGLAMQFSEKPWRRVRKHAYKLQHTWHITGLNLHLLPLLIILTAWPFLGIAALTPFNEPPLTLLVLASYTLAFILPLTMLAFLPTNRVQLAAIRHWVSRYSPLLHLLQAIVLFACGWLLLIKSNTPSGS